MSKTYRDKERNKLKNKDMLDYDDEYWELWSKFNKPDKIFKYLRRRTRKAKGDNTYVICKNCKNTVIGGYFKKDVIKKWNKENE